MQPICKLMSIVSIIPPALGCIIDDSTRETVNCLPRGKLNLNISMVEVSPHYYLHVTGKIGTRKELPIKVPVSWMETHQYVS
jgi:hypothetical protein